MITETSILYEHRLKVLQIRLKPELCEEFFKDFGQS